MPYKTAQEHLASAETKIAEAARRKNVSWSWTPWGAPHTGGPFLWNDIYVIAPDGKKRVVAAIDFISEEN